MNVDSSKVIQVYSGKPGKCCCGCAGTHTYASTNPNLQNLSRMMDVRVSDRSVTLITKKMNKLIESGEFADYSENKDFISVETDNRLYIAYFS